MTAQKQDVSHDITHWMPTWEYAGKTLLDSIGLILVVGVLKNADEAAGLVKVAIKQSDELVGGVKHIDDVIDSVQDAAKHSDELLVGVRKVNLSPEIEVKILEGQRVTGSNKLIGGHSSNINNANPNYAVQEIKVNLDGTKVVKFTTQYPDGNLSKIKTSTLFPDSWSDTDIINSVKKIGDTPAVGIRSSEGLTLHREIVNEVEIEVIRNGNDIISGFPVGGKPTTNFDPIP